MLASFDSSIEVISNDRIRPALGYPMNDSRYTPLVYRYLTSSAERLLKQGKPVILDATFYLKQYQEIVINGLRHLGCHWALVMIDTSVLPPEREVCT